MPTLVVLFNLRPGTKAGDYEAWARSTDLPAVKRLPSVKGFSVFRARGLLGSDAPSPYQYVEMLEVASVEALVQDVAGAEMQRVVKEFGAFADHPQFIVTESL